MPTRRLPTYLLLVVVVSIWGSYPTLTKLALREMPPFTLAALRCTLASGLLTWLLLRRSSRGHEPVTRADLRGLLLLGVSGITVSTGFYYLAIALTSASNAVILTATTPVLVAVGGHLAFGERLDRLQWLGVLCSAAGVLLTVTRGQFGALRDALRLGDLIVLIGQVGWAAYTLYGKRVLARLSPGLATTGAYISGTLFLIPLALLTAPAFPPARFTAPIPWAVIVFQGTVGAIIHVWYYQAVRTVGPSRSAIFMNLQPLVGVVLATTLLGEEVGFAQIVGGLAILTGVYLTTQR